MKKPPPYFQRQSPALPLQDAREIFLLTENYLFRRSICDLPTNALNKIFLMLHREIIRFDGTEADYLEKFKYALLSKVERGRFPNNDEFSESNENASIEKQKTGAGQSVAGVRPETQN